MTLICIKHGAPVTGGTSVVMTHHLHCSAKSISLYALYMKQGDGNDSKEGDQLRYLKGLMNSEVEYRLWSAEKGARYKEYKWRVSHCKMLCSGLSLTKSKGFRNVASVSCNKVKKMKRG